MKDFTARARCIGSTCRFESSSRGTPGFLCSFKIEDSESEHDGEVYEYSAYFSNLNEPLEAIGIRDLNQFSDADKRLITITVGEQFNETTGKSFGVRVLKLNVARPIVGAELDALKARLREGMGLSSSTASDPDVSGFKFGKGGDIPF